MTAAPIGRFKLSATLPMPDRIVSVYSGIGNYRQERFAEGRDCVVHLEITLFRNECDAASAVAAITQALEQIGIHQ